MKKIILYLLSIGLFALVIERIYKLALLDQTQAQSHQEKGSSSIGREQVKFKGNPYPQMNQNRSFDFKSSQNVTVLESPKKANEELSLKERSLDEINEVISEIDNKIENHELIERA